MTVYYDDLIFAGPYFQPAVWGGHTSPAYADDLVYQPPITNVAIQSQVTVNFVGSGAFAPVPATPASAFASFAGSGVFAPVVAATVSASVAFAGTGTFTPVPFGIVPTQRSVAFVAAAIFSVTARNGSGPAVEVPGSSGSGPTVVVPGSSNAYNIIVIVPGS